MAAILGTWIHKGALDVLKREFGALIEVAVEDDLLRGSADAVYLDALTVEDVKTVGRFMFDVIEQAGARRAHVWQVLLYAYLLRIGAIPPKTLRRLRRAGWEADSVPIEQVVIRYVCRDTGREFIDARDYDPKQVGEALEWIAEVCDTTASLGPEFVDRGEDGPELSVICDGCRWLTACWGPERADGGMRQANLVHDDADVAAALVEYDRAREIAKEADAAKQLARAKVSGSEAMDAVRDLYRQAGLEVPTKRSYARPSIAVKQPPKPKPVKAATRAELTIVPRPADPD
jgi:hypothetical protein